MTFLKQFCLCLCEEQQHVSTLVADMLIFVTRLSCAHCSLGFASKE